MNILIKHKDNFETVSLEALKVLLDHSNLPWFITEDQQHHTTLTVGELELDIALQ